MKFRSVEFSIGAIIALALVLGALNPSLSPAHSAIDPIVTGEPAPFTPKIEAPQLQSCRSGRVALTFDDGPHASLTPRFLRILRKHNVRATFYVTGANAKRHEALLRRVHADGHSVQNHSWNHPRFDRLSTKQITSQIRRTNQVIKRATGQQPTTMRPPYGIVNARVRKVATAQGQTVRLWSGDTADWRPGRSAKSIRSRAVKAVKKRRNSVILMHDALNNSPRTLRALPGIIKRLKKRGYCFVTEDQTGRQARLNVADLTVKESAVHNQRVAVTLRLDRPVRRHTSITVTTGSLTAQYGADFIGKTRQVVFAPGAKTATFTFIVKADRLKEATETLELRLEQPRGLIAPKRNPVVHIRDAR